MTTAHQPWVLEEAVSGGLLSDWLVISRHTSRLEADRARAKRIKERGYFSQAQLRGLRVSYRALP